MLLNGWMIYDSHHFGSKPEIYENDRFIKEAKTSNIVLNVFDPCQIDLILEHENPKSIFIDNKILDLPDFILARSGAHTSYFGLSILKQLETLGVKIFNSPKSIEISKDKFYTQQLLAQNHLPIPKTMLIKFPINEKLVKQKLGFPLIVKAISGSQGSGVYLLKDENTFRDLMQLLRLNNTNMHFILQEFVQPSYGTDIRVFLIDNKPIACIQRIATNSSFKANYSQGARAIEYPMNDEIKTLAIKTTQLLGLDFAGVDLLFDGKHFKICEANSAPGFQCLESIIDINVPAEIYRYIHSVIETT